MKPYTLVYFGDMVGVGQRGARRRQKGRIGHNTIQPLFLIDFLLGPFKVLNYGGNEI